MVIGLVDVVEELFRTSLPHKVIEDVKVFINCIHTGIDRSVDCHGSIAREPKELLQEQLVALQLSLKLAEEPFDDRIGYSSHFEVFIVGLLISNDYLVVNEGVCLTKALIQG
jgi:hypothetical protein